MEEVVSLYVFDACVLLNLVASRRLVDIAQALPARFVTPEHVVREVRYVRRGGNGADRDDREPVDLKAVQDLGLLTVARLEPPEEIAHFVGFAVDLDDGEAAACALAVHRHGTLITDDQKARRTIGRLSPAAPLLSTSQVIKAWAERARSDDSELARLLVDVEERARFRPGHHDPLAQWWSTSRIHV